METAALPTLLILGAGGHGRVVADAAQRQGAWAAIAATDRNADRCRGELLPGVALRPPAALDEAQAVGQAVHVVVHVAVGDNAARRRESEAVGLQCLATVIHPQASVSPHAHLATGCLVAAQAVVAPRARVGHGVIVNHGAVVDHDVTVGDFTHVAPGARLGGGVSIGAGVLVGAGAAVLPGRKVCDGVIIGAGAVVNRDIDEPGTWAGLPARRIS